MLYLLKKHFRSALFYALYGPPVGGLIFIFFMITTNSSSTPNLFGTVLLSIPVAYILGIVPAFITGLIVDVLPPLPPLKKIMWAALVGFFATSIFVILVDYSDTALFALGIPAALSTALLIIFQELRFKARSQSSW